MKYLRHLSTTRVKCTCHHKGGLCSCGCRKRCFIHIYQYDTIVSLKKDPGRKYKIYSVNYINQSACLIGEKGAMWDEAYVSLCDIFPVGDGIDRAIRRIK